MRWLVALESLTIVGTAAYNGFKRSCPRGAFDGPLTLPSSLRRLSIEVPERIAQECLFCSDAWDLRGAIEELTFDGGPSSRNLLRAADLLPFVETLKTLNIANARLDTLRFDGSCPPWAAVLEAPQFQSLTMRNVAVGKETPLLRILDRKGLRTCRDAADADEVLEDQISGRGGS